MTRRTRGSVVNVVTAVPKAVGIFVIVNAMLLPFSLAPPAGAAAVVSCSESSPCCCKQNTKGKLYCCTSCMCKSSKDTMCDGDDDCGIG